MTLDAPPGYRPVQLQVRQSNKALRVGIAAAILDGEDVDLSTLEPLERARIRAQVKKLRRARRRE